MVQLARAIVGVAWDLLTLAVSFLHSSRALRAENLVLRKQLASYIERGNKPRRVDHAARVRLALFTRLFDWRDTVVIVRPATLVRWHLPVGVGKPDWMSTITLYGTEDGWEALEKKNLSLDEHKALAAGLAGTVQKIYAWWLQQRRRQIADGTLPDVVRRERIRNPNKVGRSAQASCESNRRS